MKNFIVFNLFVLFGFQLRAQTVEYTHDAHGNRTQRKLSANIDIGKVAFTLPKDSTKKQEEKIMELAMNYGVSVFPNPTETDLTVAAYQVPENSSFLMTVTDQLGKVIFQEKKWQQKMIIPLASQKSGSYNLTIIINEKDVLSYKIIKQ
jgi:hypothetical protein